MEGKLIKAKAYKKNKIFEKTRDYQKFNFKYTEFSIWIPAGYFEPDVYINSMLMLPKLANRIEESGSRTISLLL